MALDSGSGSGLVAALLRGERPAMARALSAVENRTPEAQEIIEAVSPKLGRARVIGFTGAPGVGKSTLISAYVRVLRERGRTVGILAVDPSSGRTGGAVLGDRIRMLPVVGDAAIFMRSLAARGHLGGLSAAVSQAVDILDAAGKDTIVVETVGVGQSEIAVARLAQCSVVVCGPGFGDAVQAIKAGVLEIADVLVINKADHPDALRVKNELLSALSLLPRDWPRPRVIETVATEGRGIAELLEATGGDRCQGTAELASGERRRRTALALRDSTEATVRDCLVRLDDGAGPIVDKFIGGEISWPEAAAAALEFVAKEILTAAQPKAAGRTAALTTPGTRR